MPTPTRTLGVDQATFTDAVEWSAELATTTVFGAEGTVAAIMARTAESADEPCTFLARYLTE